MLTTFGTQSNFAISDIAGQANNNSSIEFAQTRGSTEQTFLFEYGSFKDLQTFDTGLLEQLFNADKPDCMVTATVTVSVSASMEGNVVIAKTGQNATISVSASVTASCSEIGNAVKRLLAELKATLGI